MTSSAHTITYDPNAANALAKYQTYGWKPCESLTDHDNFMDLVLLVTRSSKLKQGSMACVLVRPPLVESERSCDVDDDTVEKIARKTRKLNSFFLTDRIIAMATNQSFYKDNESDIHAEIVAISQVANRSYELHTSTIIECNQNGLTIIPTTQNATAYITMPPCKRCFAALVTAGIKQVVSRYPASVAVQTIATQRNVEMIVIPEDRNRIQKIIDDYRIQEKNENNVADK